ncbi:MAG: hypothetical protein HYT37_03195 [Candidatus Sungbacteria bacterium]|nr:hypothetical protein [Candidatus Sungbacteria bacterium]
MHTIYWDWLGMQPIESVLAFQDALFQKNYAGERKNMLLFAEHPHCFTYSHNKPIETQLRVPYEIFANLNVPIIKVRHGGNATYHGPGQLVAYWILDITVLPFDFIEFSTSLIDGIIGFLSGLGLSAAPTPHSELSQYHYAKGVWITGKRKITQRAISALRAPDGHLITRFGFAFNVSTNLRYFSYIFPCGLDIPMTSLEEELGIRITCKEVLLLIVRAFSKLYAPYGICFEKMDTNNKTAPAYRNGF